MSIDYKQLSPPQPVFSGSFLIGLFFGFLLGLGVAAGIAIYFFKTPMPFAEKARAPPVQFLQRAYGRVLEMMGANVDITLGRCGFYPAGGGEVSAFVEPCAALRQVELIERGKLRNAWAEAIVAGLPGAIAERELQFVGERLGWGSEQLRVNELPRDQGPGNAVLITLEYEGITEVFTAIGEKRVRAESVAEAVVAEVEDYLSSSAAAGEHLADQVMLPMALAGGGKFTMYRVSQHAITNAEVINRFLPVRIDFEQSGDQSVCVVRPG